MHIEFTILGRWWFGATLSPKPAVAPPCIVAGNVILTEEEYRSRECAAIVDAKALNLRSALMARAAEMWPPQLEDIWPAR